MEKNNLWKAYSYSLINLDIHWSVSISTIGLIGFIITFGFNLWIGSTCFPENGIDRFLMVLIGITSFFAHIGKDLIGRLENAASGALLNRSFDVIVTFLGQFIFFQVKLIPIWNIQKYFWSFWHNLFLFIEYSWHIKFNWSSININGYFYIWIF